MSLANRKSQFTDRRQSGQSDGLRAGLVRATAEKKSLPLVGITVDQSLQVRVGGLDADHLDSIVTKLTNGGEIDRAIVVFRNADGKYLLADGFHRLEAYKRVGRKNVVCEVHDGDWEAARLYAETANMEHGLRINNDDKRGILESRLARKYYENEDGVLATNAVIAADLGVTDRTIAGWLEEILTAKNFGVDLSKRVDKNGRVIAVDAIVKASAERAETNRQTKLDEQVAAENARLAERVSNVICRAKHIADAILRSPVNRHLANSLNIELPSENTPEEHKTFGYYVKAGHKHFRLTPGREETFIQDFQSTKDVKWYQGLLSVVTPAIWEQADAQDWSEDEMQDWLDGFHQRQSAPLPSAAPRPGMAQPKNPDLQYQPPAPTGRHRLTEVPATEEAADGIPPCPFAIGQWVKLANSETTGKVKDTRWVNQEWQVLVDIFMIDRWYWANELTENKEDFNRVVGDTPSSFFDADDTDEDGDESFSVRDALTPEESRVSVQNTHKSSADDAENKTPFVIGQMVFDKELQQTAEVIAINGVNITVLVEGLPEYEAWYAEFEAIQDAAPDVATAFNRPVGNKPPYEPADEIAAFRMALNNLKAAATDLKNADVTTIRLLAPTIKEIYIRDLREVEDYTHSCIMAVTQLIGRAVNV